jgi:hypothetical protein
MQAKGRSTKIALLSGVSIPVSKPLYLLLKDFLKTRLATALMLVGLINLGFFLAQPAAQVDAASLPSSHCWEWWRTRSYVKSAVPPDVVLLGSSLMMIPISFREADYLNENLDAVSHDHSVYMQDMLKERAGLADLQCFNFALPGGMISDDYMIFRALIHDDVRTRQKPKLLVIGITLRDFLESHVSSASSTNTFHYFRHFFDIDEIANIAMPEFWQKFDYWQGKVLYMVGKRLDMQVVFDAEVKKTVGVIFGRAPEKSLDDAPVLTANVAHNLKTEAEPGDYPLIPREKFLYEDNSAEYRKRFSHPSDKLFKMQSEFLSKLLNQAKADNIKVLIVNMPLTPANMSLMPVGYYDRYLQTVKTTTAQYGCAYLNLNDGKLFTSADFRDTAHMNADGGKKLIDAMVAQIKGDQGESVALAKGHSGLTTASSERTKPL